MIDSLGDNETRIKSKVKIFFFYFCVGDRWVGGYTRAEMDSGKRNLVDRSLAGVHTQSYTESRMGGRRRRIEERRRKKFHLLPKKERGSSLLNVVRV